MAKRSKADLPPLEYRPVFVMYIKKQKSRFNPSFQRFDALPGHLKLDTVARWNRNHKGKTLPEFKLSLPPVPKARRRR